MWALNAVTRETRPPAQGCPGLRANTRSCKRQEGPTLASCSAPRTRPKTAPPGCCDIRRMSHPCPGWGPGHRCAYLYRLPGQRASQIPQMPARERSVRARGSPGAGMNLTLTPCPWHPGSSFGARGGCRDWSDVSTRIHSPHVGGWPHPGPAASVWSHRTRPAIGEPQCPSQQGRGGSAWPCHVGGWDVEIWAPPGTQMEQNSGCPSPTASAGQTIEHHLPLLRPPESQVWAQMWPLNMWQEDPHGSWDKPGKATPRRPFWCFFF